MLQERIIFNSNIGRLDERMGYTDAIPVNLAAAIANKYFNIHDANASQDIWHETFTIKTGTKELPETIEVDIYHGTDDDEDFNAGIGDDNSLVINDEALYAMSDAEVISTIYHELVHLRQYKQHEEGKRGVVDDIMVPYLSSQKGNFPFDTKNEGMYIIALLVNPENESRISQVYQEAKFKLMRSPSLRSMKDKEALQSLIFATNRSSRIDEIRDCFNKVNEQIQNGEVDKLIPFVRAYSTMKTGNQDKFSKYDSHTIIQQAKKIMAIYQKAFQNYVKKIYNAIYQAMSERNK